MDYKSGGKMTTTERPEIDKELFYYVSNSTGKACIISNKKDDIKMISQGGHWTSRSKAYESLEALYKGEGILEKPCIVCGSVVNTNYIEPTKSRLIKENICFTCNHWMGWYKRKDEQNVARIRNSHFFIEPDKKGGFAGFGGREFVIEFFDGRIITTHNLWHQGDIPLIWREKLPDNSKFINQKK